MFRRTFTLAVGSGLALVLAACGGDGGDEAEPADTSAEVDVDDTVAGATGDPVDCSGSAGETVAVEIGDFTFDPTPIQVSTCDEVVWHNAHTQAHTSTGNNGDVAWSTGNIPPGGDGDPVVFDTPGEFAYRCALHPFMKGTVEVS